MDRQAIEGTQSSTADRLSRALVTALDTIPSFKRCALLDYPDHLNAGDHLIWLGSLLYLLKNRRAEIAYASSLVDFSKQSLEESGAEVIFFTGGGNLGDIWEESQLFRESVIGQNRNKRVVILPQSIHFNDAENLRRARDVFNAHPDLTVFARENQSLEHARTFFPDCKTILSPDMAFMLAELIKPHTRKGSGPDLFLRRRDKEDAFQADSLEEFRAEDWCTYTWAYDGRGKTSAFDQWYWKLPGAVWATREIWQRRLSRPLSMIDRASWSDSETCLLMAGTAYGSRNKFSWGVAFDALNQIRGARRLITNRLHAHVLAVLLDKPHVFLPNAYHKNESFFRTWTSQACLFAENQTELSESVASI